MATRERMLSDARVYNAEMNDGLEAAMKQRPREWHQMAAAVRDPAREVLDLVYLDLKRNRGVRRQLRQSLATILNYSPRGGPRVVLPAKTILLSVDEIQRVQVVAQQWLARLVLGYEVGMGFGAKWQLPRFEANMTYLRAGVYALYDLENLTPRWMRYALVAAAVLTDAVPWLRFCDLCVRLFFKAKQKRWCSRGCASVAYSRSLAKGNERERRGPPPVPREAPNLAAYNAWLRMASASGKKRRFHTSVPPTVRSR